MTKQQKLKLNFYFEGKNKLLLSLKTDLGDNRLPSNH